jgi:hypothetical protein
MLLKSLPENKYAGLSGYRKRRYRTEVAALMDELAAGGTRLRISVTGDCMRPFLKGGETVTVEKVPLSGLGVGDLVMYRDMHGYAILHRVVGTDRTKAFYAIGDALWTIEGPIAGDTVVGRITEVRMPLNGGIMTINMDSIGMKCLNYFFALRSHMRARSYGWYCIFRDWVKPLLNELAPGVSKS